MSSTAPAFPSTLASSRRILVDLWLRHRNQRTLWLGALLAGVCLAVTLGPLALLQRGMNPSALRSMACVLVAVSGAMLLTVCWLLSVANVVQQNHPVLARTVPGHVRRLRAALLSLAGAMLAVVALAAAGVVAIAGPSSPAAAVPVMAAVCGAAFVLAYTGLAVRWPALWIALWIGPALVTSAWPDIRRLLAPALPLSALPSLLALSTLAVLAAAAAVVRGLVLEGGPRHEELHAALCKRSSRLNRGTDKGLAQFLPAGQQRRLTGLRDRLYALAVGRQLARGKASPAARAMLALGPAIHWTAQLGAVASVAALVAAMGLALLMMPTSVQLGGMVTGFSCSLVFACSRIALNARGNLHATRGEQALVMLAPGVPRGGVLNRAIGGRLAAQFLCSWAFGLLTVQLVQAFLRTTVAFGTLGALGSWGQVVLLLGLSQLLLLPLLWRRWDRTPPATPASVFLLVLLPGLVALGGAALVTADVLPMTAAAALVVAAAAAWSGWQWRRIGVQPSMLPVGRLHR